LVAALLDKWVRHVLTSGKTFSSQKLFPHFLPSSIFEFQISNIKYYILLL